MRRSFAAASLLAAAAIAVSVVAQTTCPTGHDQIIHKHPSSGESKIIFTPNAELAAVSVSFQISGGASRTLAMTRAGPNRWEARGVTMKPRDVINYQYMMTTLSGASCPSRMIQATTEQLPVVAFHAAEPADEPAALLDAEPIRSGYNSAGAPADALDVKPLRSVAVTAPFTSVSTAAGAVQPLTSSAVSAGGKTAGASKLRIRVLAPFTNVVIGD